MKIMIIFGTRPEAIKMAALIKTLKNNNKLQTLICVTGQHRDMLDQVLNLFSIAPDIDLNIMEKKQDLTSITKNILQKLQPELEKYQPDLMLVHGDTTTTFAASLAAYYQQIKIAHVEAGLRTYNIYSPWPEEGNRKMVSNLASIHFAPTQTAKNNLLTEGIPENRIYVTGNTVIDSLLYMKNLINESNLKDEFDYEFSFLNQYTKFILITGHRRENFGMGFENICKAIYALSVKYPHIGFVYPVHLNPNVISPVSKILGHQTNIHLIEPKSYDRFVYLMDKSYLIMTDSGGIQEEAPSLGKPVLVMRNTTERPEAISAGTAILVGTEIEKIINITTNLLENYELYLKLRTICNPYGDGTAAKQICEIISKGEIIL
ncbi:non-hydrolyzing UDP-N-acetylglucosamine 2-epimerase [Photorhabdus sp. RW14-46]|uniref:non-hydrolyzing UDP-N-acetylglucosamine 2-epimerase n=1 Tax=Photorhabdus sp. RW14-46 TaxID=2100168 RepID=UPI0013F47CC9|nr:UDP-N-acetylglucosamine 2-epimerase (non-hydrolyzing) [Photorhabdus sp. RW14-46]NHB63677.1 UDP-N-acetylglucosamine 2-epimerase (non-hydrolyzing) [Photorhabdus sp. RW14-46]